MDHLRRVVVERGRADALEYRLPASAVVFHCAVLRRGAPVSLQPEMS